MSWAKTNFFHSRLWKWFLNGLEDLISLSRWQIEANEIVGNYLQCDFEFRSNHSRLEHFRRTKNICQTCKLRISLERGLSFFDFVFTYLGHSYHKFHRLFLEHFSWEMLIELWKMFRLWTVDLCCQLQMLYQLRQSHRQDMHLKQSICLKYLNVKTWN